MSSFNITLLVNKPVEHIFSLYLDENFMPHWISGFKGIEILKGMPREADSLYKMIVRFHDDDMVVFQKLLEVRENKKLSIEMELPQLFTYSEILFHQEGDTTQLECKVKIKGKSLKVKFAMPYVKALLLSRNQWDYQTFKRLAECKDLEKELRATRKIS